MPSKIQKAAEREEPPMAFQVSVDNREAAISYWKKERQSARQECTRRANQIKTALQTDGAKKSAPATLVRFSENLRTNQNRAHVACRELHALDEDEDELDAFLTEIDDEVDDLLAMVDATMSGPSGLSAGAIGPHEQDHDSDAESISSRASRTTLSGLDRHYYQMLSMSYNVTKDVI